MSRSDIILLVEDEPAVRRLVERLLTRAGFVVRSYPDAEQALTSADSARANLVLTDLELPGKDGAQLLAELGAKAPGALRPAVVMTGAAPETARDRLRSLGVVAPVVRKPLNVPRLLEVVEAQLEAPHRALRRMLTRDRPTSRALVLVVEDDESTREELVLLLEGEGLEVAQASDGAGALGLLRGGCSPCVILLDVVMPRMDGVEFRRHQLGEERLAAIPVIALSAAAEEAIANVSPAAHFPKPFDVDALLAAVRAFC